METDQKKGLPMITKIFIGINVLLFGITGVIYLINGNNLIGYVLLAAGITNVLYLFIKIPVKNLLFAILIFLFAAVSLWVCLEYLAAKDTMLGTIWVIITLIYLIIGFILLMKLQKKKKNES